MSEPSPMKKTYEQSNFLSGSPSAIALFSAITEQVPGSAVFVVDQDFRYLLAGGSGLQRVGMTPADLEGKYLANVVPPELLNQLLADYTAIFAGETLVREHPVGPRFYRTRGRLIKGANGRRDLAMAISYDITDELRVADLCCSE